MHTQFIDMIRRVRKQHFGIRVRNQSGYSVHNQITTRGPLLNNQSEVSIVRTSSQQEFEREHNRIAVRRVRARTPHGSSSGKYKEGAVSSLSGQGGSNNVRLVKRTASRRVLPVRYLGWDARARWTSVHHPNGAVKGRALGDGWQYGFVV